LPPEHQRYRPEQHQHGPPHIAHYLFLQTSNRHPESTVAFVFFTDAARDDVDIRLRLLD
jgi:hypothetical protein